ncbi:MAG: DivIVA domain-containing protein [Oscillospiraceae bacterium]|nr:DivIVA domain-containing protein [Oscillospiraceae bacterium]
MITAKDIRKKKFEKIKFGYSPEEVDAFLSQVESDLRLMEQELAESNNKVQLLADKVREYKASEEDLKNALIGAQKQAREVLETAKEKAEQIEEDAKSKASAIHAAAVEEQEEQLRRTSEQLEQENRTLVATQRQVATFKKTLFELYKEHLEQISKLPETIDDIEEAGEETDEAIEEVEAEVVESEDAATVDADAVADGLFAADDAAAAQQARDPFRTSEFSQKAVRAEQEDRFSDLQFGSRRDDRRRDDRRRKRS